MNYGQLKNEQPVLHECFFAFSNQQFEKGKAKMIPEGAKIYRGPAGLFGTKEGIQQLLDFYNNLDRRIAENCDPQEVYDYEFDNHECSYTNDDTEAIKLVVSYFGDEKAKTVKRKYAWVAIEDLKFV